MANSQTICVADEIQPIREQAYNEECDEKLGLAFVLDHLVKQNEACFPVSVEFPEPPDFVLSTSMGRDAVEVTRITWQRQAHVLAKARKTRGSWLLEHDQELRCDKPAEPSHFAHLKSRDEPLSGRGSLRDESSAEWVKAFQAAVKKKTEKLSKYKLAGKEVWLFLIDDTEAGMFEGVMESQLHKENIGRICKSCGFERVFVFNFGTPTTAATEGRIANPELHELYKA